MKNELVSCLVDVLVLAKPHMNRERLRSALAVLVDVDAYPRPKGPDPVEARLFDAAQARTREVLGAQLLHVVQLTQTKIEFPPDTVSKPALPAWVLWALVDTLRDSIWLREDDVTRLRLLLFSHLALPSLSPKPISSENPAPDLDSATMTSVRTAAGGIIRDIADHISYLHSPATAADLLVEAIIRISRDLVGGDQVEWRNSEIQSLQRLAAASIEAADDSGDQARRKVRRRLRFLIQELTTDMPLDARIALCHFAAIPPSIGWITPEKVPVYYDAVSRPLADSGIAEQMLDTPIWAREPPPPGLDLDAVQDDIHPHLTEVAEALRESAGRHPTLRDVSKQLATCIRSIAIFLGEFGPDENNMIENLVRAVDQRIREWEERQQIIAGDTDPSVELRRAYEHIDELKLQLAQLRDARQEAEDSKHLQEQLHTRWENLKNGLDTAVSRIVDAVRDAPPHADLMTLLSKWFAETLPGVSPGLDTGPVVRALARRQAYTPVEVTDAMQQALAARTRDIVQAPPDSAAEIVRLIAGLDQFPYSQLGGESPEVRAFTAAAAKHVVPGGGRWRRMGWGTRVLMLIAAGFFALAAVAAIVALT